MNEETNHSRIKVLVVDDEKSIRTGLAFLIRSKIDNVEVLDASNGLDAWDLIRKTCIPALIFLDIRMPGMDGLQLCSKMLEEGVQTKVVILSGYKDFDYARQAIRFGVLDYLLKPVNPTDILRFVHLAVETCAQEPGKAVPAEAQAHLTIERVRMWIHDRLDREVTLSELADEMHFSPNYLSTLFKKEIGKGFQEYLSECRMQRAKHLLGDPSLRIFEVCQKVGYSNSKAFSIAFRKAFGMTPSEYREKAGQF